MPGHDKLAHLTDQKRRNRRCGSFVLCWCLCQLQLDLALLACTEPVLRPWGASQKAQACDTPREYIRIRTSQPSTRKALGPITGQWRTAQMRPNIARFVV
jgi:hypothetical protein